MRICVGFPQVCRTFARKMDTFFQHFNRITGTQEWVQQNEQYDYHQEITRAAFADMLHDTDRNVKYELALKMAIEKMHSMGKRANVLDIGTGTGLLSMMAVRHGADTVTACEAFAPMSKCALKVIRQNGFENKIKLIPKRSTDIAVGLNKDMENVCNILVTEVFDTELIGEGALATFSHAQEFLLEENSIVIPQSATIYAQIVESPFIQNWNKIRNIYDNEGRLLVQVPSKITNCGGANAVHDIQMDQIKSKDIKFLSDPNPVCTFDWSGKNALKFSESIVTRMKVTQTGEAQVVFMWWELQMDTVGEVILSCAPFWANQTKIQPWRDHWMQAIYYLPNNIFVEKGHQIDFVTSHDEFSFWFDVNEARNERDVSRFCNCGLHMAFARTRLGQVNDNLRNKKYIKVLEKNINNNSVVLVLSEGSFVSLAAAKFGAKKVYYIETNFLSRNILEDFVKTNNITNVEIFESLKAFINTGALEKVNVVFGEPYFVNSILPWDGLAFAYIFKDVKHLLTNNFKVFPKSVSIKAIAVCFSNLNKIRKPLGECQGFVMKDFDDLIEVIHR